MSPSFSTVTALRLSNWASLAQFKLAEATQVELYHQPVIQQVSKTNVETAALGCP